MDSSIPCEWSGFKVRPVSYRKPDRTGLLEPDKPDLNRTLSRTQNRTPQALNRLRAAASQVRVNEPIEVLAAEFEHDLADIASGGVSFEALMDAVKTLARTRDWRRSWV